MALYVAIPKLGMAMTEATVVEWKIAEGGRVEKDEVVLTIETEKTSWDVEALGAGWLHVLVPEDETVPVGRVVGLIAETEVEFADLQSRPPAVIMTTEAAPEQAVGIQGDQQQPAAERRRRDVKASPVARKLAEENGLDLTAIAGTGPEGRIVREDVERALAERASGVRPAGPTGKRAATTFPLKGIRRTIAEHMTQSLAVAAQLSYMGEADMSAVVSLRAQLLEMEAEFGVRVSYMDIILAALAIALRDNPILNSSVVGDQVWVWEGINIGVAVSLDHGLEGGIVVPVVRNVDRKPIPDLSREVASLIERARAGKLMPDDIADGTFTLTNLGTVGGGWFFGTPIVNQPQSAILAIGSVSDRAVVVDGQVVVRPLMPFSLTFDHRVMDGAPAIRFAGRFVELLADPEVLLAPRA